MAENNIEELKIDIKEFIPKREIMGKAKREVPITLKAIYDYPLKVFFKEYEEKFLLNEVEFSGKLKASSVDYGDDLIFAAIDGGRKYKDRKMIRNDTDVKGYIKHYSLEEIKKMEEVQ